MNKFISNEKCQGYYLMEVLIAFIIISIGILGLLKLSTIVSIETSRNKQRNEALSYAQSKIESFRNYQTINTTSGYLAYQDIVSSSSATTIVGSNAAYSQSWTVQTYTAPDYKIINMVMTWTSQTNDPETVNLSTMISSNNPVSSTP